MTPDDKMTDKELRGRLKDIHRRITGLENGLIMLFGILAFLMLVTMFFVKGCSR